MRKELTEQWRNGTLPFGSYYINLVGDVERVDFFDGLKWERTEEFGIEEVLAPVPSYDKVKEMSQKIGRLEFDNEVLDNELKELATKNDTLAMENERLQEKLAIATKALKKYQEAINRFKKDPMNNIIMLAHQLIYDIDTDSKKALKEMEGVKCQILGKNSQDM